MLKSQQVCVRFWGLKGVAHRTRNRRAMQRSAIVRNMNILSSMKTVFPPPFRACVQRYSPTQYAVLSSAATQRATLILPLN